MQKVKFIKQQLLESIERISELTYKSEKLFETSNGGNIEKDVKIVADYFDTNRVETIIVAIIFHNNFNSGGNDFMDIAKHFDCNPLNLLMYSESFINLIGKNIIVKEKSYRRNKLSLYKDIFYINKKIIETVIQHITSQRTNIYCDVVALIQMIEQDAMPLEEPKKEKEEVAQA